MFKLVDLHNQTMMEVTKIEVKKGSIATKGKVMGTMPGTFYLYPDQLWSMVKMVNLALILHMPGMILRGIWNSRKQSDKPKG